MKEFSHINTKFPNIQDETLTLMYDLFQKHITAISLREASTQENNPQQETLITHTDVAIQKINFESWFLQTFSSELEVVDWLLDRDLDAIDSDAIGLSSSAATPVSKETKTTNSPLKTV